MRCSHQINVYNTRENLQRFLIDAESCGRWVQLLHQTCIFQDTADCRGVLSQQVFSSSELKTFKTF